MPSTRVPTTTVTTSGGPAPTAGFGGGAVTSDASTIIYGGGSDWADTTANPPGNVESQLDKIVTDLATGDGAGKIQYDGGPAWADTTTNPAATVGDQLDKIITDLATGDGAGKIQYNGGAAWADATTNPAATVGVQIDKIISDLAGASGAAKIGATITTTWFDATGISASTVSTAIGEILTDLASVTSGASGAHRTGVGTGDLLTWANGDPVLDGSSLLNTLNSIISNLADNTNPTTDGASHVGADGVGNLTTGSVRDQLNQLDTDKGGLALANTWTAANTFNGASGDSNAALLTTAEPTFVKLLWEIHTGTLFDTRVRLYTGPDRSLLVTINARWNDGTSMWERDETGVHSSKLKIDRIDWKVEQRLSSSSSPWLDSAWDTLKFLEVSSGEFHGDGVQVAYVGMQGDGPANIGVGTNYRRRFDNTPSSYTYTSISDFAIDAGPTSFANHTTGTGSYCSVTAANDATAWWYGHVAVS